MPHGEAALCATVSCRHDTDTNSDTSSDEEHRSECEQAQERSRAPSLEKVNRRENRPDKKHERRKTVTHLPLAAARIENDPASNEKRERETDEQVGAWRNL